MAFVERNKKRTSGKIILLAAFMLAGTDLSIGAKIKEDIRFGFYTGWAVGFKPEFAWHTASVRNGYNLNFHLGAYLQFERPERFGVQLNLNFQNGSHPWTYHSLSGTDTFSFSSANLNFVFPYARSGNARFYLLAGAGISSTSEMYNFYDGFINFVGGTGVRIHLQQGLPTIVNLGLTFHHLWDSREYNDAHANLVRFNIGLETLINRRKN